MMVLKVGADPADQKAAINAALRVLKSGGVIAFPSETVYGIGCDARNEKAVRRLFTIKGRGKQKPIQLIAGSFAQVLKIAEMNTASRRAAKKYWPGPFTLLLPKKSGIKIPKLVSPSNTVGIRVTPPPFLQKLIRAFGRPIAATSANKSGEKPASSGRGVIKQLTNPDRPDLLIDMGAIPRRAPTTVASIDDQGRVSIHRQGGIRLPKNILK